MFRLKPGELYSAAMAGKSHPGHAPAPGSATHNANPTSQSQPSVVLSTQEAPQSEIQNPKSKIANAGDERRPPKILPLRKNENPRTRNAEAPTRQNSGIENENKQSSQDSVPLESLPPTLQSSVQNAAPAIPRAACGAGVPACGFAGHPRPELPMNPSIPGSAGIPAGHALSPPSKKTELNDTQNAPSRPIIQYPVSSIQEPGAAPDPRPFPMPSIRQSINPSSTSATASPLPESSIQHHESGNSEQASAGSPSIQNGEELCYDCGAPLPPLLANGQRPRTACVACGARLYPPATTFDPCPLCEAAQPILANNERPSSVCRRCRSTLPPPGNRFVTHCPNCGSAIHLPAADGTRISERCPDCHAIVPLLEPATTSITTRTE
jgi:hypothetical protein